MKSRVRDITLGLLIGFLLGGGIVYAAVQRVQLVTGAEHALGTTEHPLYIEIQ